MNKDERKNRGLYRDDGGQSVVYSAPHRAGPAYDTKQQPTDRWVHLTEPSVRFKVLTAGGERRCRTERREKKGAHCSFGVEHDQGPELRS